MTWLFSAPVPTISHHALRVSWGDVPTWVAVIGALLAAWVALRQLRSQQEDIARQTAQLERQQANDVDHTWLPEARVLILASPPLEAHDELAVIVVSNNSGRPIRDVTCWIEPEPPYAKRLLPRWLGPAQAHDEGTFDFTIFNPRPGTQVPLIRPGYRYGFLLEFTIPEDDAAHPERRLARVRVQFTDDLGIRWQIDQDLHLEKVPESDHKPWTGLLGPPNP